MTIVKLHNTLDSSVNEVKQSNETLKMFVCGPTVYDLAHIGHAKTYIQMDVIARTLRSAGYELYYLQNITDIDDKIITRAKEQKRDWQDLSEEFEDSYHRDMATLNINSVDRYARATEHIAGIIQQVETLLDKGHAYIIDNDGIYFEISTFPEYGKLSGRQDIQSDDAQSRIDDSEKKRGWNDFCLWKFSKSGEPTWQAPFGDGRPGWHIEDTAITEHYFGPQYDIHGGAIDLIFPHHEAEITQMESASGKKPFVGTWVHSGFLNVQGDKMSKSQGNFITIKDVLDKGYDPMALRLLMLQSHYRSGIDFSWDMLDEADSRMRQLRSVADLRWQPIKADNPPPELDFDKYRGDFLDKMANDINTPDALAEISVRFNTISSQLIASNQLEQFSQYLRLIDDVFGLNLLDSTDITAEQKQLIDERETARQSGDYETADRLREQLKQQGLELRDSPYGAVWARA